MKHITILMICTILLADFSVSASPPGEPKSKIELSKTKVASIDQAILVETVSPVAEAIEIKHASLVVADAIAPTESKKNVDLDKYRRRLFYSKYILKLPDVYDKIKKNRLNLVVYRC